MELFLIEAIVFAAFFLSAISGFGAAMLAMPLLTLILGIEVATPLYGLMSITSNILLVGILWQTVQLTVASRLFLGTLPGIAWGLWLLKTIPAVVVIKGLGVLLVGFGCYQLIPSQVPHLPFPHLKRPHLKHPHWAYGFGFLAGALGAAYNTNGPRSSSMVTSASGNLKNFGPHYKDTSYPRV
jgi:uncharacterized membrane protein YfcA